MRIQDAHPLGTSEIDPVLVVNGDAPQFGQATLVDPDQLLLELSLRSARRCHDSTAGRSFRGAVRGFGLIAATAHSSEHG